MRYRQEIVIDRPVDQVVKLFDSPENMMQWFPGLVSFEHLSGEPGAPGAKSKLLFKMKRGDFELIETITVNNLPEEFSGTYETVGKGIFNTMSNNFVPVGEGSTCYTAEIEYRFSGLKWKVMSLFLGPVFKRQSFKTMRLFKEFTESSPAAGSTGSVGSADAETA